MNRLKTMMLLAALTALVLWMGQAIGGRSGLMFAFVFAAVMNFVSYWFSDKIVLRMYRAQEVDESEAHDLFAIVRSLSTKMNIPMPRVYIIPEASAERVRDGPQSVQHAAVAATAGILEILNHDELEGVLAHELGHVVNRDTLVSTVAATLAGALGQLAHMAMWAGMMGGRSNDNEGRSNPIAGLIGIIIAPIAAMLIQLAISRSRGNWGPTRPAQN